MEDKISKIFGEIKSRLENSLPFVKSEIIELRKPSLPGNDGLHYSIETDNNGVAIFFWDTGVFEIMTDLIVSADGSSFFFSHTPTNYQSQKHSNDDIDFFVEKVNELISLLPRMV